MGRGTDRDPSLNLVPAHQPSSGSPNAQVPTSQLLRELVDLGGAETNSEMAIEMLPESRRNRVVVCNAPVVEGAVMAATEAASGATLEAVRRTAEELTPV